MDTLQSLALQPVAVLRDAALYATRFLSLCCTQLVAAKEAKILGDDALSKQHVLMANKFWLRSQEVEADQVKRCMRDIAARGGELVETGTHRGIGAHVSMREAYRADGARRSLSTSASESAR